MKSNLLYLPFFAAAFYSIHGACQAPWSWNLTDGPVVIVGETAIPHPFTGGLSAPQWSEIDVDWDGDMDLFAFDRDGGRILVFENTDAGNWKERSDWSQGWPALKHWVLLRDFDCDGLPDLFTGYQNSVHVYRNTSVTPGVPTFEAYALPLMASWDFGTGAQELPIVCLTIDKPAIFDVDNDGDLDFISFTETSTTMYRFSGQSACGLDLICTNRCYGMVSEGSEDNTLFIGEEHSCSFNVIEPESRPAPIKEAVVERDGVHAGGAITALQLDGDNFHDLLISDVTYPTMSGLMLENANDGQDSTAWVDMGFPSLVPHEGEADSIVLQRFPAAYPIDPDNDGDWDLVISPNISLEIDDDQCAQLWENQGTVDNPLWALASDNWIHDGTIDVGRGAIPILHDMDGDGDLDLAVGNKERYEGVNTTPTDLALFENIGTVTEPTFKWKTWSAIDFSFNGIESAHPAFGDIDGDGDTDVIVGDELGLLHTYSNEAGPGMWPIWNLNQLAIEGAEGEVIDVGQFAAPQLIDINSDGLLDLITGEKNGTLSLYLNCGSPTVPAWCIQSTPSLGTNWGGIQVNNALGINGYSTPCLFADGSTIHIASGNELGEIQYFGTLDSADFLAPLYTNGSSWNESMRGLRSNGTIGDVDGDGIPELVVGIQNGGMRWFNGIAVGIATQFWSDPFFAPNPAQAGGFIRVNLMEPCHVNWFDIQGRWIHSSNILRSEASSIPVPDSPGFYLMTMQTESGGIIKSVRIVVQ